MAAQLDILGSKEPAERAEILRAFLEDARTLAGARILSGEGGEATCRSFASSLDVLAVAVYELARSEHAGGTFPRIVLLATGGWGRRETCPYSDIDLLVLTDAPSGDAVKALAERLLYPLWDAGVSVGHQVLSVSDARTLLAKDLPTATTLLDARPLAGDQELAMELLSDVPRALAHGDPNGFLRRLVEEKQSRHDRFGDSLYLLEPNLKQGQGALRDLATGLWAARARWRVNDFTDLVPLGQASARQVANLTAARELLLRVRAACHAIAKRRQDQLSFELQEAIAPKFFPNARVREGETRPAVAPAVEELMRRYYLVAKAVVRETDRLLDRAMVPAKRPPAIRRIDASFTIFNGHLSATDPEVFRQRPSEMVRLFRVALDLGLPIYGHTKELCAEIIAEEGASLAESDEAKRHFVLLLIDPRDNRQPSLLEEMHDLGILAALMPEFAPCTGRVQHDLYHVFTVDQHQLYAVALLKRIARGELQREAAAATEAIRLVTRPRALFLATLLHDVGKPLGKGHAEKGARLCAAISRRLGLSDEDVHQAEFLVRHHLLMSHLSQRRDLSDVGMVASFADTVRDEETLTELYLLTYCDTTMTAPGNLTEWKDTLQRELYDRTRAFFRRGPDLAGADRSALVKRRRRRVAELLGEVMDGGALDNVTSIGNQPARVARGRGEARRPEAPRPPARERGEAPRPPARERGEAPR
ncbi:MAG: HD domain-containing protein, partial [Deltaproteobacteria bacterium]|nr:HD domain-containing protein [Deltaproteobacteria bacterium]